MCSVYLRLKKRHPDDKGAHILPAGEVEKDQGLEAIVVAAQELDDSEDEEDGDLTLNFHKSRLASAELLIALEQGLVDIALVQEPWIASGNIVAGLRSSNYNTFYSPTVNRNRSAVLVRKGIHANLMPHYSSDDLTAVMLESEEQRLLVASCYMAHDRSAPPDELSSLVELGSKNDQLLIGADANAHHSVWGSSDINDRVYKVCDLETRDQPRYSKIRERHRKALETLSKELLDAYHASCPTSRTREKTRPPLWNRELTLQRHNLREFFKIAKKADDEIINEEYKILLRDYENETRRAQRSSWRNFCSSIENVPETARLRKLLSKQPSIQSQLKRDDGQWFSDINARAVKRP
ncbi:uncharacterized protein [Drosophila takahashii]|uniref:uncharacterized protein n=1 Tax=Drosophila takahashii TaxID=29030 RepID=UPI003899474E